LELGWPLELLRVNGYIDTIQIIQPRNSGKTRNNLNRIKEKLNGEINSRITEGFVDTNRLETQLDATEWMLDTLVDREQQPFDYTHLLTVHGKTRQDCDTTFQRVQSRLKMMGIKVEEPLFRVDQAQKTLNPHRNNHLNEHNLLLSNSVAAGFPFGTRTIDQASGIIYGEDQFDSTPILQNRFNWHAPHLARFGATGSGKSYHTKLELLRTHLTDPDTQIIVIDPKNEYKDTIETFDGTVHNVTDRPEQLDHTVCFQVSERGQSSSISEIIELIEYLYKLTSQNQDKTLVVIDEAHNITNVEEGRNILTRWIREARDTSTAITVISQSASDFTQFPEGRTLLDQCPAKVFFRHQRVSDSMIDYFQLSEQEVIDLYNLKTGTDSQDSEAVLKISGRIDTKLQINATPAEHTLIEQ